ncbi:ABC transporter ATP-binding protein [Clostridium grantii]|uniref:ABC-2 type transport system ATP-binding protein n=1 Tax=Clostridium grantii DSM 8605 TaxID=1121316 RepID=A0A1M5QDU7_9CLOT|nr:ABC transporter ATP-binding protein [Clostridium grantii]SHH12364.1 ABC-2 type transport system ATP-binding protein [Clostridium grantii DSM 8605]
MIKVSKVYKSIEDNNILKNIDFSLEKGSIFGLIGPNGAGKTTLIKCLTGIYEADKGSITIMDEPIYNNKYLKEKIAYVPDSCTFFEFNKIKDVIKFYKLTYKNFDMNKFNRINKVFNIPLNSSVKKLSKGMNMRFSILLALCINPEVVILDEPLSGIDPIVKSQILKLLIEEVSERETTVIISSHNLSQLEKICDTIAVMNNGEIKHFSSLDEMKENFRKLQLVFKDSSLVKIENLPGIVSFNNIGRVHTFVTSKYDDFKKALTGIELVLCEEIDLSLEDIFIHSLGGDGIEEIL